MAGIGIELRKLLRTQTYAGLARAYVDAGLISSGPWVLSMLTVAFVGVVSLSRFSIYGQVDAFMVSVTHLVAVSLIFTGPVQLLYTRFVADRLFEKKQRLVLPNLIGLLTITNIAGGIFAVVILLWLFGDTSILYRVEMATSFVLLCTVWCLTVFLSGMKKYRPILYCFAAGYGSVLVLGAVLKRYGVEGLLGAFTLGQSILAFSLFFLVLRDYASDQLVSWEWTRSRFTHRILALIGFFYNLGIFVDKFEFWYNPATSVPVIGPLRNSPLYDFPFFLAYLSMVPGMAVLLVRMETDFAERYDVYYDAVRGGDTLAHIERLRVSLTDTARHGIYEILKIQGTTIALLLLFGPLLLKVIQVSTGYLPLFNIDVVAVGVQVLFLAILNVLFYLDKLRQALLLCGLFMVLNTVITWLTQLWGVSFYGYGYALSLSLASLLGLGLLSRTMERLTYETFMYQPGPSGVIAQEEMARKARKRRPALGNQPA